ncbi:hypothetical protein DICSQDRAFT_65500 [Dichomitus squalens LYAD-421 SS1]|uniref:Uncharacterized protein n=2 Tax=Dichomitus squalens TaxID=114155 RepID=A0A4Q9MK48_9APHY|nr:uncharacterized protein DICSQDRAFT_65500 [Dichomitus squalens LYAD-421 SS1]EJF59172.1 hypothetical protein DICSQDRAFT_65500 [Dichomitus squalens LYAD-421 SS1]TBU27795.1 hypothetical protein BD311DRAFT_664633 [Dichomitus squalens]
MPSDYRYERIPTSDEKRRVPRQEPTSDDPRFNPPTPSPWKRFALVLFLVFLLYVGLKLRVNAIKNLEPEPSVVHATRYSKDYKYRPAASPIITERLKDGRTRVRGAAPTARR